MNETKKSSSNSKPHTQLLAYNNNNNIQIIKFPRPYRSIVALCNNILYIQRMDHFHVLFDICCVGIRKFYWFFFVCVCEVNGFIYNFRPFFSHSVLSFTKLVLYNYYHHHYCDRFAFFI